MNTLPDARRYWGIFNTQRQRKGENSSSVPKGTDIKEHSPFLCLLYGHSMSPNDVGQKFLWITDTSLTNKKSHDTSDSEHIKKTTNDERNMTPIPRRSNLKKGDAVSHDIVTHQNNYALFERIVEICKGNPRIAILMSGTGSNARKILEQRHRYPNFQFTAIATDRPLSHAYAMAREFGLAHTLVVQWGNVHLKPKPFFDELSLHFRHMGIDFLIYAGFLRVTPKDFLTEFPGINIHPADLTILNDDGLPKYRGMNIVSRALNAGEKYVASTIHVVEEAVDGGLVLAVSKHIPLSPEKRYDAAELHEELKRTCEHALYPQILALLSRSELTGNMLPLRAEYQDLDTLI